MSHPLYDETIGDRRLRVVATTRGDGSFHPERVDPATLRRRQQSITGRSWSVIDQVHGAQVVEAPADPSQRGDVLVTESVGVAVAVWAADCAPLILAADDGTLVAAHAGWRGLAAGVVEVAVDAACRSGGVVAAAILGPVIGPCCYAFSRSDADAVPAAVGGVTASGEFALDVAATVSGTLASQGVTLDVSGPCTGCSTQWFSHRVRNDVGRHAVVAWWDECKDGVR